MAIYVFMLQPVPKPRQSRSDKWKKRPCVVRYREFADKLREIANKDGFVLANGMQYQFYLPMPKSWPAKKKEQLCGKFCDQKPDLDNLIKAVFDAIAKEDKHIASIGKAEKFWAHEAKIIITT